jgi:HPr kinase/phosphorylase
VANAGPTIHASAVLVGAHAVLIRGPSGSGKSRLALNLISSADRQPLIFARLVADDRVHLQSVHGRLIARPPPVLAGLLEVRGLGVRRLPYEAMAVVSWVVDLAAAKPERLPDSAAMQTMIEGIRLPRLAVATGRDPFPMIIAALTSTPFLATASPDDARSGGHEGQSHATARRRAAPA